MGFVKKHLSADGLHKAVINSLQKEKLKELKKSAYSWKDCVMSGLAIFGLKFPSLLKFEERNKEDAVIRRNLKNLYHVEVAPSDTCMRERLDELSPGNLRRPFRTIFAFLQRGKMLERFSYLNNHYIISIDGTGQFSSNKIHCQNCCEKYHREEKAGYNYQRIAINELVPETAIGVCVVETGEDKNIVIKQFNEKAVLLKPKTVADKKLYAMIKNKAVGSRFDDDEKDQLIKSTLLGKYTREVTYYHQMLGAAIVHPDEKVVIPLAPEPIVKGDGTDKNDCERNAAKRMLTDFRREHPHLKTIIVEDGLASNYPHLSLLDSLKLQYIIGVKPGDHAFLFDWIKTIKAEEFSITQNNIVHKFRYAHDVPLNDKNFDYKVNVLEYWEQKPSGKLQYFSWVTSFKITRDNAFALMRAGRARWRIENETFNTLKNNGYNFEHNYGHGYKNLCSVMTMLMMLAFLIDQVQFLCCKLRKQVREKCGPWYFVFETIRSVFQIAVWDSWTQMYEMIIDPENHPPPNWYGKPMSVAK